jgi:hypothetical protein
VPDRLANTVFAFVEVREDLATGGGGEGFEDAIHRDSLIK